MSKRHCHSPAARGGHCDSSRATHVVFRTFRDIVQDYIARYRTRAEHERAFFQSMRSIKSVIEKAATAMCEDGKKNDHQWRIPTSTLTSAAEVLLSKRVELSQCSAFQELIDLIDQTIGQIKGIGELAIYDTALRIGANLAIDPDRVYLHRGTRKGAAALGLASRRKYLEVIELPREFRRLKPYEIEDCLCIYAKQFSRLRRPP